MTRALKPAERFERIRNLINRIQECEIEAREVGLHVAGHALNDAKNACGWEAAGNIEVAAMASKGRRVGERSGGRG